MLKIVNFKNLFYKNITKSIIGFIGIIFFNIGCGVIPNLGPGNKTDLATAAQPDCGYVQDDYGQRVSWKSNTPVKIFVDASLQEDLYEQIQLAAKTWDDSAGKTLFQIQKLPNNETRVPIRDGMNTIHMSKDWDDAKKTQQALTTLAYRGSQITEADIKINHDDYEYYVDNAQNSNQVHFLSVMIHELGHVLGFKHLQTKPTVMWSTLAFNFVRDKLSPFDVNTLKCEY